MAELSSYPAVTTLAGTERFPLVTTPGIAGGNKYITADNLALFTGGGGGGVVGANVISLADYGAVGDGVADDSHAIRDWCLAATAAPRSFDQPVTMYAPPGTYKTTVAGATYGLFEWGAGGVEGVVGVVPSFAKVIGVPGETWFYQTGVPASATDGGGPIDVASYMLLGVKNGSEYILFEDLSFRGENDPFVWVNNNQAACIDIMLSTTHDVTVRKCNFRNIYGFSVHDRGDDENIHVKDCWFYECSNGLNVNGNGTIQTGNLMETSEGIECSGARAMIANNVIIDAQRSGIAMGGAGDYRYGVVVANNVIDGSTGAGIEIGDGCFGTVIDGNFVRKSKYQGIRFGGAFGGWNPSHCVVSNNTFVDNGLISAGAGIGMEIECDNHIVTGNMCYNTGDDVLYDQMVGCLVRGDNCYISGNYLAGGALRDLEIPNTAANTRLGPNFLATGTVYWEPGGTSTLAADSGWFKATTDKIREHWISGEFGAARFAEYADGKLEWGEGSAARDTNLYRSAADTLKTDDRFKTGASTTGSRPSAATAGDGAEWYDTTLKRRITSDGTNWLAYIAATGPSTGWAVTNVTTDKVFDANATSIDELADVLGTLITYLISRGDLAA